MIVQLSGDGLPQIPDCHLRFENGLTCEYTTQRPTRNHRGLCRTLFLMALSKFFCSSDLGISEAVSLRCLSGLRFGSVPCGGDFDPREFEPAGPDQVDEVVAVGQKVRTGRQCEQVGSQCSCGRFCPTEPIETLYSKQWKP